MYSHTSRPEFSLRCRFTKYKNVPDGMISRIDFGIRNPPPEEGWLAAHLHMDSRKPRFSARADRCVAGAIAICSRIGEHRREAEIRADKIRQPRRYIQNGEVRPEGINVDGAQASRHAVGVRGWMNYWKCARREEMVACI
jgi:hypothetical protein